MVVKAQMQLCITLKRVNKRYKTHICITLCTRNIRHGL